MVRIGHGRTSGTTEEVSRADRQEIDVQLDSHV
jgi:hypothetical protein